MTFGMDNGVTGTIACLNDFFIEFIETPIKKEQNYTKKKDLISRVDAVALREWFKKCIDGTDAQKHMVVMERPLVNPTMLKATCSALRCFEAELCIVESLELPHIFVDSKDWQRDMLPKGCKGTPELKKASMDIGIRLFPQFEKEIREHKDADALLMAEWARRNR